MSDTLRDLRGRTPLFLAVEHCHIEAVRILINGFNADPEARDNREQVYDEEAGRDCWGETPLICSAKKGYTEIVMFLVLDGYADPNVKDKCMPFQISPCVLWWFAEDRFASLRPMVIC